MRCVVPLGVRVQSASLLFAAVGIAGILDAVDIARADKTFAAVAAVAGICSVGKSASDIAEAVALGPYI